MTPRTPLLALTPLLLLAGCLSRQDSIEFHDLVAPLEPLDLREAPGLRELRFPAVVDRVELRRGLLWRVTDTELVVDEQHRWTRSPAELLDERLRDLLLAGGGFRATLRPGVPTLEVELVRCDGDLRGEPGVAVVELVLGLDSSDAQHRHRLRVEEPLARRDADAQAAAVGRALSRAAEGAESWLRARL
jgi:uncharacterized lipoprotein YmbA